ncbi:hypothetical protein H0H92_012693 [Tricholoma furcatifolium]|nr:hypothetical protein H0H92_012693 [Tricholoma furcatifolium]
MEMFSTLLAIILFTMQFWHASPTNVQEIATRSFPPGLSIPSDITLWGSYSYLGCFTDSASARSLTALSVSFSGMTIELCLDFCNSQGGYYNLAYTGLEYGQECYCDWVLQDTAVQVDDSECNMPCSGDSSEPCGAGNRLTVIWLGHSPTSAPATITAGGGSGSQWAYQGCYQDSLAARILPMQEPVWDQMYFTLEACAEACFNAGFSIAGAEYRDECWCGNALPEDAVLAPNADCGMACVYDYNERCGGSDRISVYKLVE